MQVNNNADEYDIFIQTCPSLIFIYIAESHPNFSSKKQKDHTMARSHSRSPKLSLSRSVARVRVHSPSLRRKPASNCIENDQELEFLGKGGADNLINSETGTEFGSGNKVMVVVDASVEAKGALEWALSHTIQSQDTIVLLHVAKPRKRG